MNSARAIRAVRPPSDDSRDASVTVLQKSPSRKRKSNPQSASTRDERPNCEFRKTGGLFCKNPAEPPSLSLARRPTAAPPPTCALAAPLLSARIDGQGPLRRRALHLLAADRPPGGRRRAGFFDVAIAVRGDGFAHRRPLRRPNGPGCHPSGSPPSPLPAPHGLRPARALACSSGSSAARPRPPSLGDVT